MLKLKKAASLIPMLLLAQPAWPVEDLISSQLADEARSWQQKERDDLAADLWRKLLRSNPGHAQALVNLGMIELRAGNIKEAEALQQRARRLTPAPAGLNALTAALHAAKGQHAPAPEAAPREPAQPAQLKPEKAPARQDSEKKAGKKIEKKAEKRPPLAQFESESAINEHWAETRRSLEELVREHPGDGEYLFALARHLARREATRREAIRQLGSLPLRGREVRATWRQALLALDTRAGDLPLFEAYLKRFPKDAEIGNRLRAQRQQALAAPQPAGFAAQPALPARLLPAAGQQDSAAALLGQALADEQAGAYGAAASKLESAMLLDPANPRIRIALARQYQQLGAAERAASLLDDLLVSDPGQPEALQARAALSASRQRWLEGLQLLEKIPVARRTAGMAQDQRQMWINLQAQRARQLYAQGDAGQAVALAERLQSAAGTDDALLGLVAAAWADVGQPARGLRLMREVLSRSPAQSAAMRIRYAQMLLHAFQDAELATVLRDLALPGRLDSAQQQQVNAIILDYTLRMAQSLREAGQTAEAAAMLAPLMRRSDDVRLLLAMARIHQAGAEPAKGLALVEAAIARQPDNLAHRLFAVELALAAGTLDKAGAHARAALEIAPRHPRALAAAGRVEKARGNRSAALGYAQLAQAKERDPAAFAGAPEQLMLRLADDAAQPDARSGLLPIPDPRPHAPADDAGRPGGLLPLPLPSSGTMLPLPAAGSLSPVSARTAAPAAGGPSSAQRPLLYQPSASGLYATRAMPAFTPQHLIWTAPASGADAAPGNAEDEGIRLKLATSLKLRGPARARGRTL